jgi:vacuolar protein sorting-associated protein IST1
MIQVMKKLANNMPSADLVEAYLTEIARGYGVRWTSDPKQVSDDGQHDGQDSVVVSDIAILISTHSTCLPFR